MKVTAPGQLVFLPGRAVVVHGWHFHLRANESYPDGIESKACKRAQLLAALAHIAEVSGVDLEAESLTPAPERVLALWRRQDLDGEREVANIITKARTGAKGRA